MIIAVLNDASTTEHASVACLLAAVRAHAGRNVLLMRAPSARCTKPAENLWELVEMKLGAAARVSEDELIRVELAHLASRYDDVVIDAGTRDTAGSRARRQSGPAPADRFGRQQRSAAWPRSRCHTPARGAVAPIQDYQDMHRHRIGRTWLLPHWRGSRLARASERMGVAGVSPCVHCVRHLGSSTNRKPCASAIKAGGNGIEKK